jgi:hypothetical protein
VIIVIMATLTVLLIVTLVGGLAALPLAAGAFTVMTAIVLVFKAFVNWGEPTVRS